MSVIAVEASQNVDEKCIIISVVVVASVVKINWFIMQTNLIYLIFILSLWWCLVGQLTLNYNTVQITIKFSVFSFQFSMFIITIKNPVFLDQDGYFKLQLLDLDIYFSFTLCKCKNIDLFGGNITIISFLVLKWTTSSICVRSQLVGNLINWK